MLISTLDDDGRSVRSADTSTVTNTYDAGDRLTQEMTPEGTVSYTDDAADRRAAMTVSGQSALRVRCRESIEQYHTGAVVAFTYDNAGRRSVLSLPDGISVSYTYDAASQLTGIAYASGLTNLGNLTYAYDSAGRRTAVGRGWARTGLPNAFSSATYDGNNQIATWAGTSFTYDPNGKLASDGVTSYTWNARNQLTALSGSVSASFQYDGFGRRRAKTNLTADRHGSLSTHQQ